MYTACAHCRFSAAPSLSPERQLHRLLGWLVGVCLVGPYKPACSTLATMAEALVTTNVSLEASGLTFPEGQQCCPVMGLS